MSQIVICKESDTMFEIDPDGWDYPVSEIGYLLERDDSGCMPEVFILKDGRLYETIV